MNNYMKHLNKTFTVHGFNEPRKLKIVGFYYLGGRLKYPAYQCEVVGDYKHFKSGDRENFLCKDVLKDNELKEMVKVLSA